MPLQKKSASNGSTAVATPPAATTPAPAQANPLMKPNGALMATLPSPAKELGGVHKAGDKIEAPMTKDDYWRRREDRDIERDKHMAWSGLAQAALGSVSVAQLNTENTEDGLVSLVSRIVDKLLIVRDSR